MALAVDRVQRALRKLRKSLRRLPADPTPEQVHQLRTQSRHIEDIAAALTSPDEKELRRLLKSIEPVRKAAGRVRDMDVLIGNATSLPRAASSDSLIHLVESLKIVRQKSAGKLLDTIHRERKSALRNLEEYENLIESRAVEENSPLSLSIRKRPPELRLDAKVAQLLRNLSSTPTLHPRSLHRYRLKIKELRSILQLMNDSDNSLLGALGKTKDAIGEWHDWQQLADLAAQSLNARNDRALLARIRETCRRKLRNALTAASALRKRCQLPAAKVHRAA